jgi:hypothetical protein
MSRATNGRWKVVFGDGRMDLCGILWMSKIDETRIYMTPPLANGYRPNNRVKTGRAGMGGGRRRRGANIEVSCGEPTRQMAQVGM